MFHLYFIKVYCLFLLVIVPVVLHAAPHEQNREGQRKQNILFIGVDDLNDWCKGFDGHPDAITPNIDKLLESGVVFKNAQCAAPICNPSRTALFTGLRPSSTGVYGNSQPFRFNEKSKDAVTIPQYLQKHGYYTCGSGKMYHGAFPDPFGWDEYFPSLLKHVPSERKPEDRPLCGIEDIGNVDWGPIDLTNEEMRDYKTVDYCISQINKNHDEPSFIACGIKLPHLPWYAPKKYFDMYDPEKITMPLLKEDDLDDVPRAGQKMIHKELFEKIQASGKWNEGIVAYLACVTFIDEQIGRLLAALEKSGKADNTIIVFWGDHGWHLGEKMHWKKNTLWAEAAQSPLFISVPGLTPKNVVCDRPVNLLDLYPTILDLCGLPEKEELEGVSIVDLLKNPETEWNQPSLCTRKRGNHALLDERWRYIHYEDGTEELYDHQNDPNEWNNLADDLKYKEIKNNFKKWLPKNDAEDAPEFDKKTYRQRIKKLSLEKGLIIE